jgi:hypothetical protein
LHSKPLAFVAPPLAVQSLQTNCRHFRHRPPEKASSSLPQILQAIAIVSAPPPRAQKEKNFRAAPDGYNSGVIDDKNGFPLIGELLINN